MLHCYNNEMRGVLVTPKRKLFLFCVLLMLGGMVKAQDTNLVTYTRGSGFVICPEMYNGLFATFGYQINPYVQVSGGLGFGIDGGLCSTIGVRTYTSDAKWAPIFDYHVGVIGYSGELFMRHTIIGGVSFKDFDFGAGLMYVTDGYDSGIGLSLTIGYNIRCYPHR